ncbi:MAG: hypothetical protein K8T25_15390, partial [Planctomycetia bacterium]|nr:hypothetical protein [Planctomycetia bacterium]
MDISQSPPAERAWREETGIIGLAPGNCNSHAMLFKQVENLSGPIPAHVVTDQDEYYRFPQVGFAKDKLPSV